MPVWLGLLVGILIGIIISQIILILLFEKRIKDQFEIIDELIDLLEKKNVDQM